MRNLSALRLSVQAIEERIDDIEENQIQIKSLIENINIPGNDNEHTTDIRTIFPLKCIGDLQELENQLADVNYKKNVVSFKQILRNIL